MNTLADPVFVIGPPRCGSTLIYNILCSDEHVNPALSENHFLTQLCSTFQFSLSRLAGEQGHFFKDAHDAREFFSQCADKFMKKVGTQYPESECLILKSISLSTKVALLLELVPHARFCVCVRDPRDIISSMIDVGQKQQAMGSTNQYPSDVATLAQHVLESYTHCLLDAPIKVKGRSLIVRYESIVSNPLEALDELQAKTGLDLTGYDPAGDWPRNRMDIEARKKAGAPYITEHWGKGVSSQSVGKYRSRLSSEEIAVIESVCKPIFDYLEYPVGDIKDA